MPIHNVFTLKRIPSEDAALYKGLRVEGLDESPEAFGASYSDEVNTPLSHYSKLLTNNIVYGAYSDRGSLVGIAGLRIPKQEKLKHKATLWGMYIKPEARGNGLAKQILLQIIEIAKETTEEILLTVVVSNVSAITLYENLGFIEYGREPRALKIQDHYHDEILMRLPLT
ncbi:GNAT family N-acetyltransferase [uncultured Kiloniella sp.]|uniref:GNAT family N-acetyltransferase n=1 Tax=uncultured Kiloniella sp. TaxID=1133091 RepID=UPI00260ADB14|nr:GNAT family N-acetyltransferase [uncultured Kiloniella sp.]